ncbi:hypothetical protein [Kyrpidia tusciae]|nr:hypothetical protein [Kyrpidia tusciae]
MTELSVRTLHYCEEIGASGSDYTKEEQRLNDFLAELIGAMVLRRRQLGLTQEQLGENRGQAIGDRQAGDRERSAAFGYPDPSCECAGSTAETGPGGSWEGTFGGFGRSVIITGFLQEAETLSAG